MAVDHQWPPAEGSAGLLSDLESFDEFSEIELMRVSRYPKEGGQAKLNSPEDPGDTPRHSNVQGRENLLNVPGTLLCSALRGLTSVVERKGKQGPRRRKKSLGGASKLALGEPSLPGGRESRPLPWNQPPSPKSLASCCLGGPRVIPWSLREPKSPSTRALGRNPWFGQVGQVVSVLAMAGEDNDPNRDPVPKSQVSRPGPSSLPTISPPTLPRTHVFTCASSVHPSGVAIGCPSVSGSLGCQIGVLLLGTNVKVALRVCWVWFSTLGLFPASSTRLGLEWKGGLVAELGQGDPLKASQSFGV